MEDIDFSKIYSYSKLTLFSKCKKKYYFNYLDPEIAPIKKQFIKPRDYKTKGQAVHGAITLFYHLFPEEQTFENLKKCLSNAWFSEIDVSKEPPLGKTGGFENLEHERKVYLDSLYLLKNFLKIEKVSPSLFFLPTKNIRDSFDDYKNLIKPIDDKFFVSGKFDRVDKLKNGNLKVIDFKTGKNDQDYFQLKFYKVLAELNFNKKVDIVSFYYLDKKKVKSYNVSKVDTGEIKNRILEKINIIRDTKEFPAEPNRLCSHCDFKEICPVFKTNKNSRKIS